MQKQRFGIGDLLVYRSPRICTGRGMHSNLDLDQFFFFFFAKGSEVCSFKSGTKAELGYLLHLKQISASILSPRAVVPRHSCRASLDVAHW